MAKLLAQKTASQAPNWVDRGAYPFASHWIDLPDGRMHFIDEGKGYPLVFVHGNPSWSYEYRHLIRHFSKTHRCIAMDHLGFGLSDKPLNASYLPQFHAENFRLFVEALGLEKFALIVQDWGGPIALDYAVRNAGRIHSITASNSWFFDVRGYTILRRFSRIMGSPIGRVLCLYFNFFPRTLMKMSFGDAARLDADTHKQYLAPLGSIASRKGSWVFPRSIVGESEWLERIWARREALKDVPVQLIWGMKDDAFAPLLPQWAEAFPNHRLVEFADVGHNVAEEAGERMIAPIETFLAQGCGG